MKTWGVRLIKEFWQWNMKVHDERYVDLWGETMILCRDYFLSHVMKMEV